MKKKCFESAYLNQYLNFLDKGLQVRMKIFVKVTETKKLAGKYVGGGKETGAFLVQNPQPVFSTR